MTVEELQSKRGQLYAKIKDLATAFKANAERWESDSQKREWESVNQEFDSVDEKLEAALTGKKVGDRLEQIERDSSRPINPHNIGLQDAGGPKGRRSNGDGDSTFVVDNRGRRQRVLHRGDSMAAAVRKSMPEAASRYRGLNVGTYLRSMALGARNAMERAALHEGSDSSGGYTVPAILSAQVIDLLRAQSRVSQAGAGTIRIGSERESYAKLASEPTPVWRRESEEVTEGELTFAKITFEAKSLAVLVKASRELLEDSNNIGSMLPKVLARAMADEVDRVALLGAGSEAEPLGVLNMPNVNELSLGDDGAAIEDYADLLDAVEMIETDNGPAPTAAIMHPRTKRAYAGLVDLDGQPLMAPEALQGISFLPTTKIPIDQTQGSATNASSIIVGGFSELVLAMRNIVRIEVLKERYAEKLQYGFLVHLRMDVGAWHEQALANIIGVIPAVEE